MTAFIFRFQLGVLLGLSTIAEAKIPQYDELFPLSIKACAVSPYKDVNHKRVNDMNYWGHSVLFLKGVCKDRTSPLPKIQMCDGSLDLKDPNAGTLISVVRSFRNTGWIAIEDGKFAFHGDLEPADPVDGTTGQVIGSQATERSIFQNIELSEIGETRFRSSNLPRQEFLETITVGTDYALDLMRTSYCHVYPVTREQMVDAVDYLNQLNRAYTVEGKPFEWHLYENNCQHTVNNTLAVLGISKFIPVVKNLLPIGILKVHPPAGSFIEYAKQTVRSLDHFNVRSAFKDTIIRKSFETYGRPPIVHGSMVEVIPMHTENNHLYVSFPRLFAAPLSPKFNTFNKWLNEPRLRDLELNLKMFKASYDRLKVELLPLEKILEKKRKLRTPEFEKFYQIYREWLDQASEEVDEMIQRFS